MNPEGAPDWGRSGIDRRAVVALAYLALPNLIFLPGWFRWPIAILLCAAVVHLLVQALPSGQSQRRSDTDRSALLLIVATAAAWAAFGGGSHFMYANPDWNVRDAVLGDLVFADWPVHYVSAEGTERVLRSAMGFFLPPALFGRVFGIAHLELAVYLWTAGGVLIFLLLLPLPRNSTGRLAAGLCLVVFFSGMDFLGQVIATESLPLFPLRLEWWVPLSYPSLTNQLLWAPNHCLPLWIGTLLLLRHFASDDFLRIALATLPLTLIWTPFAALGLAPFALLGAAQAIRRRGRRILPRAGLASAAVLSGTLVAFLLVDVGAINAGIATSAAAGSVSYTLQGASPQAYLLFVACEFLLLALVLTPHLSQSREVFGLAVVFLLLLPLVQFGPSNDILLRLCAPPLVVVLVTCLQILLDPSRRQAGTTLVLAWVFLAIGGHTAFNEFWRAASYPRTPADYLHSLADKQDGNPAAHYAGRFGSSVIAPLLKPPGKSADKAIRHAH